MGRWVEYATSLEKFYGRQHHRNITHPPFPHVHVLFEGPILAGGRRSLFNNVLSTQATHPPFVFCNTHLLYSNVFDQHIFVRNHPRH